MKNLNSAEGFNFTILHEEALTEDLFDDKTHERVSQNLANIITSSETGFTIGLEGSWGSGKSTVINLLREKLFSDSNQQKPLFFLFDAWAHEGDPLRRIFLESIIRELDLEEKIAALTHLKQKINGRNRSVDVRTKKSTSMLGKILSVAALLIAPGATFLGNVDYNLLSVPWQTESSNPNYLFIYGMLLSFAPIIVLPFWAAFGQKNKVTNRRSWDFFTTESTESYTQDITEENERSSIEFEDYFKEILEIAQKECNINKFIFVIDNLDRVDSAHALNIWSTLQTFFQKRSLGTSAKNIPPKDLWFLIPYDREGFVRIWPGETGSSFLRKCFQLIVEVPDPVMSGWASYAELTIRKALGTWPIEKLERAIFCYIQNISRLDKSPTPRDIKAYANQIGMLGKTWGSEFSIESMSLYVLLREDYSVDKIRKDLVAGHIFAYTTLEEGNSEQLAELSSLVFGVVKEKGLQLLLGPEIKSAFQQGDGKHLENLKSSHGTAFWIAYEASKTDWMPTRSHTVEYRTQLTKAFYSGLIDEKIRIEKDINRIAENWMESIPQWEISVFDYAKPMRHLLELYNKNPILLEKINDQTKLQVLDIIDTIDSKKFISNSLKNIYELEQLLEEHMLPLTRLLYAKLNVENWKNWQNQASIQKVVIKSVLPANETITLLAAEVGFTNSSLSLEPLKLLSNTLPLYPESKEWDGVANSLIKWLQFPDRTNNMEAAYILALNLLTFASPQAKTKLLNCIQSPQFWVAENGSPEVVSVTLPILAAIAFERDLQSSEHPSALVKNFWKTNLPEEKATALFNKVYLADQLQLFWFLATDSKNQLAIQIVKDLSPNPLFRIDSGANLIDEFEWADDKEIDRLALKLVDFGSFSANQKRMESDPILYQWVYRIFHKTKNKGVAKFIREEILKVTTEQWLEQFENESGLLELLEKGKKYLAFSEALSQYLSSLARGEKVLGEESEFTTIIGSVFENALDVESIMLPRITQEYFGMEDDNVGEKEFEFLKNYFERHTKEIDPKYYMARMNKWFEKSDFYRLDWISQVSLKPTKQPFEGLVERIKVAMASDDNEMMKIANALNLKLKIGLEIEHPEP